MSRARRIIYLSIYLSVGLLTLLAGISLGVGHAFCDATLHVPRKTGPQPAGSQLAEISAPDGAALQAWWFPAQQESGRCVIVLHGVADSRTSSAGFAPLFLADGYAVLAPDSRAHGTSGGAFVTYGLLEKFDVIAWTQWMRRRGCRAIYGLGESLGAAILIQAIPLNSESGQPAFRAIVAESSYADLRAMAIYRVRGSGSPSPLWNLLANAVVASGLLYARRFDGLDFTQVSPVRSIAQSSTPILLIHGLADRQTPPAQSRELAAARPANTQLWLVKFAGHTDASTVEPEKFRTLVLAWFREH